MDYSELDDFVNRVQGEDMGGFFLGQLGSCVVRKLHTSGHLKELRALADYAMRSERYASDEAVKSLAEGKMGEAGIGDFEIGSVYYEGGARANVLEVGWVFQSFSVGRDVNNHDQSCVVKLLFVPDSKYKDGYLNLTLPEAVARLKPSVATPS